LFLASTYRVYGNFDFYKEPESVQVENISQAVKGIVKNKDTAKVFLSFYIQDGYLMSWDATTDWRLDIWQDVFYDLKDKKKLIIGYGYKEIIPIMLDPTAPGRLGRDGLNENVHNYFVNILARGGLLQLGLFLIFYTYLIKHYRIKHGNYKILSLLIPVLILSSLDVTMEGVHFPFIFFSYLGYLSREGI
jgi:O-antigen ligase